MNTRDLKLKIAKGEIEEVLKELLPFLEEKNPSLYNRVLGVSGNYYDWKRDNDEGLEPSPVTLAKIRKALLSFIDEATKLLEVVEDQMKSSVESSENLSQLERIQLAFKIKDKDAALLLYHLGSSKFEWRFLETLATKTGFSIEQLEAIARNYPEWIKRGVGKGQKPIIGLQKEARQILNNI